MMASINAETAKYDAVIVGGGPVGLLTAYGLQKSGISTVVVERDDKANMPMYGRACTLFPRTIEMLDQHGLLDAMNQIGFIARNSFTYDKDGNRVTTRGWHSLFDHLGATFLDYCLNIRLKNSEEIFQEAYVKAGGKVMISWELTDIKSNEEAVSATIRSLVDESTATVQGKYLIGCDGGRSTVRRLTGMVSERVPGVGPPLTWIRIDGHTKTNLPDSQLGLGAIESPTHGNVLWVTLDHGASRIGYCLPPEKAKELDGKITEEQAVEEAQKAMTPWELTFESVDWFSNYNIHQSIAKEYIKGRVILAGDACHTHSSGAAQGMNTGVHDAVNLAWKLSGVLKGWYKEDVLTTYQSERRAAAQQVIDLDQTYSQLISGIIPEKYKGWTKSVNELLRFTWEESVQFNNGLGISYKKNVFNDDTTTGNITEGHRAPDALIYSPGSRIARRIQQVTPNTGAFWIVVFAGEPLVTKPNVAVFRSFIDSSALLKQWEKRGILRFITIVQYERPLAEQALGCRPFGDAYYDNDGSAHTKYGLTADNGGVVVLRPDGMLGMATRLRTGEMVERYFERFVKVE